MPRRSALPTPTEVEAGLELDRQRQVRAQGPGIGAVSASWRTRGRIGSSTPSFAPRPGRRRSGGEHEHVGVELERVGVLAHVDPECRGATASSRVTPAGSAVPSSAQKTAPSTSSTRSPANARRVDPLDGNAESGLRFATFLQFREAGFRGGEKQIADRLEQITAEAGEERCALSRQQHLWLGGELLTDTAKRLPARPRGDRVELRQNDVRPHRATPR